MLNTNSSNLTGDDQSVLPKYYQVKQWILERITLDEWKIDDEIPSEQQLCADLGISRGTLRRAVDELVRQGHLTRVQGKSTKVAKPKIPIFSKGFRADIQSTGQTPNSAIEFFGLRSVSTEIKQILSVDQQTLVYVLRRIILADSEPVILETVYIPEPYGRDLSVDALLGTSLLDLIPRACSLIIKKAIESYEPVELTVDEALSLKVKPGELAILDQAVTYDVHNAPIFLSKALIRRDKARIVTEVTFHI
ncbi:MAG: GntR family transcriptional regulator [Bacilli bacterium]